MTRFRAVAVRANEGDDEDDDRLEWGVVDPTGVLEGGKRSRETNRTSPVSVKGG